MGPLNKLSLAFREIKQYSLWLALAYFFVTPFMLETLMRGG